MSSEIQKLYDPSNGEMQVVGLMSGTGTNLVAILQFEKQLREKTGSSPYHVAAIFANVKDPDECMAQEISQKWRIPVQILDSVEFYAQRGKLPKDHQTRIDYDVATRELISEYHPAVLALAGYMRIARAPLINHFLCINVHPADLTILNEKGKRKYTGDHAVRDAILTEEKELRSTTHIATERVDDGPILMISAKLPVVLDPNESLENEVYLDMVADAHKKELKKIGDWVIFPRTLLHVAEGKYAIGPQKEIYFMGEICPKGVWL